MLILNTKSHMLEIDLDLMEVDISIPNMTDYDDTIRVGQKMALFVDVIKQRSLIDEPLIVAKDEIEDITIVKGVDVGNGANDMDIEENNNDEDNNDDNVDSDVKDENENDKDDNDNEVKNKEKEQEEEEDDNGDFIYLDELSQLSAMGFVDNEYIRGLLMENKGNVGAVVQV